MNCTECKELLIAYIEGLLDPQHNESVRLHLESCTGCREEVNHLRALQQRLISNGRICSQTDVGNSVMDAIMRRQAFELRKADKDKQRMHVWRILMKNRIIQLAAVAIIIIAVGLGIYFFAGEGTKACCAWEDIIRPIMDARTAELDIVIGEEGQAPLIHDMIMGSKIRRTLEGMEGTVSIIDLAAARILTLDPEKKKATYIDLKDLPQMPNYMDQLRGVIKTLEDSPHFVVEELGEEFLDDRIVYGFRARHPGVEITIWVDPETALPFRIEQESGQMKIICTNIQFDVEMDESLFSMDAPEDYKIEQQELNLLGSTEEDFIEGLRIQAQNVYDGKFPDDVSVEYYIKMAPILGEKLDKLPVSDDEKMALGMKLSKGLMFIRFFQGQGKWYYDGDGVELGDADTPIFWYQPQGSQTYRVIYGDLSVGDVAEENLPAPVEKEEKQPLGFQEWSKDDFAGVQEDNWHITPAGQIEAYCTVELRKLPEGVSVMPVKLPYGAAQLQSVTLAGELLDTEQTGPGRYDVTLDMDKLQAGETKIEFVWTMPLDSLQKTQEMFRTELAAMIPVVSFKLTIVLDDNCGYVFSEDPSQWKFVPFSWNSDAPKSYFGSCGVPIEPTEQ